MACQETNGADPIPQTVDDEVGKVVEELVNMCVGDNGNEKCDIDFYAITLDMLPEEVLLHIFSFINAKFVIKVISLVSKTFNDIIDNPVFWRTRIRKRWPKPYPAIPVDEETFNWKNACIEREEQHHLWSNHEENMEQYKLGSGLLSSVDAVHLMQGGRILVAGSRNRDFKVVDVSKLDTNNQHPLAQSELLHKSAVHKGWVWNINSCDQILSTGSWDTYIKFWDMEAQFTEINQVRCQSAVLCSHFERDWMVAGCYGKKVYHIDPRTAQVINKKSYHKRAVLCLAATDQKVFTGSEDGTVVIYDRRADKVQKVIEMGETFPMCLAITRDELWVGDKLGDVYLFNGQGEDTSAAKHYDVGHSSKITGIIPTLGALYTSSMDKTLRISSPTRHPDPIATLSVDRSEISRIDYQNSVLAGAFSNGFIGIWKPKGLLFDSIL